MKRITTLLCVLLAASASAQLTVKPNTSSNTDTFIYVQDQILFVEQDIALTKNADVDVMTDTIQSSIFLRGESQLIQGATNSNNSGNGTISVFQEGSTNQWDYNNWSSPVSLAANDMDVTAPDGNGFFGSRTLYTPFGKVKSGERTAITGYDSGASDGANEVAVSIPSYWFFYYPNGTDYQGWTQVQDADGIIPSGYGFTMKGVTGADTFVADDFEPTVENNPGSAQRYEFRGRPNSGTVGIPTIAAENTTFIGNPYPSALDLSYFLLEYSQHNAVDADNDDTTPDDPVSVVDCTDLTEAGGGGPIERKNVITGIAYFWDSNPNVQSHFLIDYQGGLEIFAPVDCTTTGISTAATYFRYDNDGNPIAGSNQSPAMTGAVGYNRRYAAIGQGFYVVGSATYPGVGLGGDLLAFENRHRTYVKETSGDSDFKFHQGTQPANKNTTETEENNLVVIPKLRLHVEVDETYTRQLALGFWPTATTGIDYAMDGRITTPISTDAGFLHGNDSYGIDVRPFEVTDRIPLFLKVNHQADVKFTATSFENFDTENVFIYDSETDRYYNVKYTSWSTTLQEGNYNGRFFLTFEEEEVLDTDEFAANNFDIFQNNPGSQLEIRNPNGLDLKAVTVYDITGKRVISERNLDAQPVFTFSTRNLQEAIYVVKITTSDDIEVAKKITVSPRN